MVFLLVVLTVMAFIAVDFILRREDQKVKALEKSMDSPIFLSPEKALKKFGEESKRSYHVSHTWMMPSDDGYVYVGLDKFMTDIFTSEVRIENLPLIGTHIPQGTKIWDVHFKNRKVSQLAPISGEIVNINPVFRMNIPLQTDQIEQSWILKIRPENVKSETQQLIGHQQAHMINNALRDEFYLYAQRGNYLNDGGRFDSNFLAKMSNGDWVDLIQRFFPYEAFNSGE